MIGAVLVSIVVLLLGCFLQKYLKVRGSLEKLGIPVVPTYFIFGKS